MSLIASTRYTKRDLEQWDRDVRLDKLVAESTDWDRVERLAMDEIEKFGADYVSTSWGKDSTVVAHLAWKMRQAGWDAAPLVWIRVDPIANPDCHLVRDEFLSRFPMDYHEIGIDCWHDPDGRVRARGTLEQGIAECRKRWGPRYVGGVRAEESSSRKVRMKAFGLSAPEACAPIGWWPTDRVFAYLYHYDLPVHPTYACNQGGLWERNRLRVGSLGTGRGRGRGRLEWELLYYGREMHQWGFRR